jgi:hypothetical protein
LICSDLTIFKSDNPPNADSVPNMPNVPNVTMPLLTADEKNPAELVATAFDTDSIDKTTASARCWQCLGRQRRQ